MREHARSASASQWPVPLCWGVVPRGVGRLHCRCRRLSPRALIFRRFAGCLRSGVRACGPSSLVSARVGCAVCALSIGSSRVEACCAGSCRGCYTRCSAPWPRFSSSARRRLVVLSFGSVVDSSHAGPSLPLHPWGGPEPGSVGSCDPPVCALRLPSGGGPRVLGLNALSVGPCGDSELRCASRCAVAGCRGWACPEAWALRPGGRGVLSLRATWLILPVVICLSQRLSHACLSISDYTVKLRMAH